MGGRRKERDGQRRSRSIDGLFAHVNALLLLQSNSDSCVI